MYVHIYIYIYIYKNTPKIKTTLGGTNIVTINLDGGMITPIKKPSEANIVTINVDGGTINLDGGNKVVI